MSYLKLFEHYNIPNNLLLKLLNVYKCLGKNDYYKTALDNKLNAFNSDSIIINTISLVKYLNLKVSDDRIRLLLYKDSAPRTKEEEKVINIRNTINEINHQAYELNYSINSADLLQYLRNITGKDIKFNQNKFVLQGEQNSVRYFFNQALDLLDEYLKYEKMENIMATTVVIMETYNMKPFSDYNDLAVMILYYYMLLKSSCYALILKPFFKILINDLDKFKKVVSDGSINYDRDMLLINETFEYTLNLILTIYKTLEDDCKANSFVKRSQKGDLIIDCILKEVPSIFSKEDIQKRYPEVSLTTITRCLNELKNEDKIMPLGTGRSAKWQRLVDYNNPIDRFKEEN